MKIIGREKELRIFKGILSSQQAEFMAVYGRRRVGKTFLIHEFFASSDIYIECTGMKDAAVRQQIAHFMEGFTQAFYPHLPGNTALTPPKTWKEAFQILTIEIKKIAADKIVVLFLDELPWLASRKSGVLQSLDYFWNTQWSRMPNFKLIVCGSAASWMINHLINDKGGLHNRTTKTILLQPFNLSETKLYLQKKKIKIPEKEVLHIYMTMGGIPYYLNHLDPAKSVSQNINMMCFKSEGLLYGEFPKLFRSLFDSPELAIKIVKAIAQKTYGISLAELLTKTGKLVGGRFQERLNELEEAGFIQKFLPYGRKNRDHHYRLVDPYCLFYLTWIVDFVEAKNIPRGVDHWARLSKSPYWNNWVGYAFENICHLHVDKIIEALELSGIGCVVSRWRSVPPQGSSEIGTEIDMLLDRDDGAITLCEMKYCAQSFMIDKSYAKLLANKITIFEKHFKSSKQVFLVMITTNGFKENIWSADLVSGSLELKDLF